MFAERLICSWIGAFGLAAGAFCQTYVQFSIDAGPIPGSINQKGEIAGTYVDFANGFHGFVRDPGGKITAFDAPGSFSSTRAISINAGGAITGTFIDTTPPVVRTRAYVRDPEGNFTTFDPPGSVSTVPQSINARGAISGYYNESNQRLFGFVLQPNGKITSIDPPGSISTQAFGINAKGAITGYYSDGHGTHGFLREPTGTIISFDVPEGTGTFPASINDAGAITGSYINPGPFPGSVPRTFGFVRDPDGNFTSFDPGPRDTVPQIIQQRRSDCGLFGRPCPGHFSRFCAVARGNEYCIRPAVLLSRIDHNRKHPRQRIRKHERQRGDRRCVQFVDAAVSYRGLGAFSVNICARYARPNFTQRLFPEPVAAQNRRMRITSLSRKRTSSA